MPSFRCGGREAPLRAGRSLVSALRVLVQGGLPDDAVEASAPRTVDCRGERTERPALRGPPGPGTGGGAPATVIPSGARDRAGCAILRLRMFGRTICALFLTG